MTIADVHFGNILNQWQQYTEGTKDLPHHDSLQKLAIDALKDLDKSNRTFQQRLESNSLDKIAICEISTLAETISRIANCLLQNDELIRNGHIDAAVAEESTERLNTLELVIHEKILDTSLIEIMPSFAIEKLRLLPENSLALDALMGENALLHSSILSRAFDAWSKELIYHLLANANLTTVENLISFFEENTDKEYNIIKLLKTHVENSQQEARRQMDTHQFITFDRQWNLPPQRDWVYNNKITPFSDCDEPEKMDAWDFLKQSAIELERARLKPEEKFLRGVSLYQGEKGDYYLNINKKNSTESGKQILGNGNYEKLNDWNTYFWSPDGISFFQMKSQGFRGTSKSYSSTFETEEGNKNALVKIQANDVFAFAFDKSDTLTRYERLDLDAARTLCREIKSKQAQLIPYAVARKPEYLFQTENGEYIYVDSTYEKKSYDFTVYKKENELYQTQAVKNVSRARDGGTTRIELDDGSSIFCPVSKEENPSYTDINGQQHSIQRINTEGFDFTSIGLELESMNPRRTMKDLF
ncbi:MAG: hypothetical protein ACI8RA_001847 [Chlamydiales bacterium]|jgi:hypothetical protein